MSTPAPQPAPRSADAWLIAADGALRTLLGRPAARRPSPALSAEAAVLPADQAQLAGALMRVNHVGEVCAQALYNGQALATSNDALRAHLQAAAQEEGDHLAWTQERLDALGARPSALNPLWYAGSFALGFLAGRISDEASLGFVVETERQVEAHLAEHLARLPRADAASRAVVAAMQADEARHGEDAKAQGAAELPLPVREAMRLAAKVMTSTAHHI